MRYLDMKTKHQARIDSLPIQFAFSNEQFEEGMRELGLSPTDTDKVCKIPYGGFVRNTDIELVLNTFNEIEAEMKAALDSNDEFLIEAMVYELGNHEYGYTMDDFETKIALRGLGLSFKDERTKRLFEVAKQEYIDGLGGEI